MKQVFIYATLLGIAACARLDYLPPGVPGGSGGYTGATGPGAGATGTKFGSSGTETFGGPGSGAGGYTGAAVGAGYTRGTGGAGYSGGYSGGTSAGNFPGGSATVGYSGGGAGGFTGGGGRPGAGSEIPILRYENNNNIDTYNYLYETGNGINAQEEGDARGDGTQAQGSFSYTAPDGQQIEVRYTAGQEGFVPQGAHLPTPPPIPAEIQKAIEQNLADEARGIVDDGQYRPGPEEGGYKGGYQAGTGGYQGGTGVSYQGGTGAVYQAGASGGYQGGAGGGGYQSVSGSDYRGGAAGVAGGTPSTQYGTPVQGGLGSGQGGPGGYRY